MWVVVVLSIFTGGLFLVGYGLYVMWRDSKFSQKTRIWLTVVAVVCLLIIGAASSASEKQSKPPAQNEPVAAVTATETPVSSPTATAPLTAAGYKQRLATDRQSLLRLLARIASSGAKGEINHAAFGSLSGKAQAIADAWLNLRPPSSLKTIDAAWRQSLKSLSALKAPHSGSLQGLRGRVAACIAALRKTGGLAGNSTCAAISANMARGIWVESAADYFKSACSTIQFRVLDKDADSIKGRKLKIYGQVFQIQDAGAGSYWKGYPGGIQPRTSMLVAVTNLGYEMWSDNVGVAFDGRLAHIYENDIVTVWGTCVGSYSYTSVAGYKMTVPLIHAKYVAKQ